MAAESSAPTETVGYFVGAILRGRFDGEFDSIYAALQTRQKAISLEKGLAFKVGDRVVFNGSVRPKYLVGIEGVVTACKGNRITVNVTDPAAGRYRGNTKTPADIIDKIEAE